MQPTHAAAAGMGGKGWVGKEMPREDRGGGRVSAVRGRGKSEGGEGGARHRVSHARHRRLAASARPALPAKPSVRELARAQHSVLPWVPSQGRRSKTLARSTGRTHGLERPLPRGVTRAWPLPLLRVSGNGRPAHCAAAPVSDKAARVGRCVHAHARARALVYVCVCARACVFVLLIYERSDAAPTMATCAARPTWASRVRGVARPALAPAPATPSDAAQRLRLRQRHVQVARAVRCPTGLM
jgi:hypothetical protein